MKKILFTMAVLTLITTGCSKKENITKPEEEIDLTQNVFSTDEDFKNYKSYNFTKSIIDNRIPYAQMTCINPHFDIPISNINLIKSKILKYQKLIKPDNITTESLNDYPTTYLTNYYQFNDKGFLVKAISLQYQIYNGRIMPFRWFSYDYNLLEYGIETVERENGIISDSFTIGFQKTADEVYTTVHNQTSRIIKSNEIYDGDTKLTYYPDEEKYRLDYLDNNHDYEIFERGVLTQSQDQGYKYYFNEDKSFRVNISTGEKESKPQVFEYKYLPCGLATFKSELIEDSTCTYNITYNELLDAYDDEFILLTKLMPLEKPEE